MNKYKYADAMKYKSGDKDSHGIFWAPGKGDLHDCYFSTNHWLNLKTFLSIEVELRSCSHLVLQRF